MDQVASLRGLPAPKGVEAGTLPRERVRDRLEDTLTEADRQAFGRLTALYRLLGFIGPRDDYEDLYLDFASGALIGFYEPNDDRFWVVTDEGNLDFGSFDATLRATTAHEFVHALQDARFDLPSLLESAAADPDWSLALSAVLEGDAVQHERLWALEHIAGSEVGGELPRGVSGGRIPAAVERELRWPYEGGLDWVSLAGSKDGNALTGAVLAGQRITTAEVLHPGLRDSGWQPREVSLPDLSGALGDGWKRNSGGSFGEFRLRNLLQLHLAGLRAVAAAAGWTGDRYDVYKRGDDGAAILRIAFSSQDEAAEFTSSMSAWVEAAGAGPLKPGEAATLPDGRALVVAPLPEGALLVFATTADAARNAYDAFSQS